MGPPLTYPQEGVSASYMIARCHCRPGAGPPADAFLVLCLLLSSSSKFFILALCPTDAPVGLVSYYATVMNLLPSWARNDACL